MREHRKHIVTLDELRRKFPLGATVYYKGAPFATVCGYNTFINGSRDNEPEVMYVSWKVERQYGANKIGQFAIRSPNFRTKPYLLTVCQLHSSGIGHSSDRKITVWFNPREQFEHGKVWQDLTNCEWAIWEQDLHKVVR